MQGFLVNNFLHEVLKRNQFEELSLCHKLWLCNPYIFAIQCRKQYPTMNPLRSYKVWVWNLHHQVANDIEIRKFWFVANTQFLWGNIICIVNFLSHHGRHKGCFRTQQDLGIDRIFLTIYNLLHICWLTWIIEISNFFQILWRLFHF